MVTKMQINQTLRVKIADALNGTQLSSASHPKIIEKLKVLFNQHEEQDEFFNAFISILQNIMVSMVKHPYMDRVIEFVAKFAVTLGNTTSTEAQTNESKNMTTSIDEVENYFLVNLINFLLKNHRANSDAIRYRCCHILARLMSAINNEQFIDEELFDRLTDAMLERLKDINSRVQVQAISAIFRLQDPHDKNCGVIKALVFLINHDPNWQVRFQALSNIAFSKHTLPHIIDRVRDTHPMIRRKALVILSEKVLIKYITIEKRLFILNYSLKDDDLNVQETCCKKLLPSWLAFKENNMLKLLKALDVIRATELCELMLNALYKDENIECLVRDFGLIDEKRMLVNTDKLDAECVFYWKWLCDKCKRELLDDFMDKILPSLSEYCEYIREALENITEFDNDLIDTNNDETTNAFKRLENTFIIRNLIKMMSFLDYTDAHGKKSAIVLCQELLANHKYTFLFNEIIQVYRELIPNVQTRVNDIVELISELTNPDENEETETTHNYEITIQEQAAAVTVAAAEDEMQMSVAEIQNKLSLLKFERLQVQEKFQLLCKDMNNVDKETDAQELAEVRNQLKFLKDQEAELEKLIKRKDDLAVAPVIEASRHTSISQLSRLSRKEPIDPFTLDYHCLKLTICILEDKELKKETPQLRSLFDTLIVKNVAQSDEILRLLGISALNRFCILSLNTARKYLSILTQAIEHDKEEIVKEAFKALINLILMFSLEKLLDNNQDLTTQVLQVMTPLIDHENDEIRLLAVEGFCKLFMTGHVISAKLFSKLLIMYYSPLTEHDKKLRASLTYFLPQFAFFKATNQVCVEESFMITVKCLINAPPDSHLSQIDINKIIETLLHLTNPKNLLRKPNQVAQNICHENICRAICLAISDEENAFKLKIYVKILQTLDLTQADYNSLKELRTYASEASDQIKDKLLSKSMDKFCDSLKEMSNARRSEATPKNDKSDDTSVSSERTLVNESLNQSEMIDHDFVKIKKKAKTNTTTTNTTTTTTNTTNAHKPPSEATTTPSNLEKTLNSTQTSLSDLSKSLKDCSVRVDRLNEESLRKKSSHCDDTITNENDKTLEEKSIASRSSRSSSSRLVNKVLTSLNNQCGTSEKRTRNKVDKKKVTSKSVDSPSRVSNASSEEEPPQKIRRSSRTITKSIIVKNKEKSSSPLRRSARKNSK